MPTITYREIRPGKWVKEVDGKAVGPATAAEVAAWKQEKATPAHIWADVMKVAKAPPAKAESPAGPATHKEPDKSTVWEDLVKRAQPRVQGPNPSQRHPPKEDADWAEQVKIWQDARKGAKKPGPQSAQPTAQGAPPVPRPTSEVKPTPTKAFAAEVAAPRLAAKAPKPAAETKPEDKAAPVKKAPAARLAPKPAPPAKLAAKTEVKPAKEPARAQKTPLAETPAAPKTPAAKTAPQKPATKTTGKAGPAVRAAPAKKKTATGKHAKPAQEKLPAKLLDEIAAEESAPAPKPEEEATPAKERSRSRAKGSPAAVSRRTAGKAKAAAAQERPNQLYLWMAAGQTDDLVATVRTGLTRYQERFSHPAEVVLCHGLDLPALEGAKLPVDLREGKSLAPRNFWIGLK